GRREPRARERAGLQPRRRSERGGSVPYAPQILFCSAFCSTDAIEPGIRLARNDTRGTGYRTLCAPPRGAAAFGSGGGRCWGFTSSIAAHACGPGYPDAGAAPPVPEERRG